jgi:hypothetical protein
MRTLAAIILVLTSSLSLAQGFVPGPTLTAATPYPPTSSQPSKGVLFVDGQEQPAGACRIRRLADRSACVDCDLSSLTRLGTYSLQMAVEDASGNRSQKSAALQIEIGKPSCAKADPTTGKVRCQLELVQPTSRAGGACITAFEARWLTPSSGTFTLYKASGSSLISVVSGRKAPASAACDCATPIQMGTTNYCPLAGGDATEVTLCQKR